MKHQKVLPMHLLSSSQHHIILFIPLLNNFMSAIQLLGKVSSYRVKQLLPDQVLPPSSSLFSWESWQISMHLKPRRPGKWIQRWQIIRINGEVISYAAWGVPGCQVRLGSLICLLCQQPLFNDCKWDSVNRLKAALCILSIATIGSSMSKNAYVQYKEANIGEDTKIHCCMFVMLGCLSAIFRI